MTTAPDPTPANSAPPAGSACPAESAAPTACPDCLARAWLLGRLAGHLDVVRARIDRLLDLADDDLIEAVAGSHVSQVRDERAGFDPDAYARRCARAGLEVVCRCDPAYPTGLWALPAEPAVLHVAGGVERLARLAGAEAVAVVGARRASPYALENARTLSRDLARAEVTVVSGMAAGVDAAAHAGALEASGRTVAVLACAPDRPYPPASGALHRRIVATACAVSELGPGVSVRRWMFPARNRIIAALGAMTVVVAARRGSGALLTAELARELGRPVGAMPGQTTAPLSWGPHELVKAGARLVTGVADVMTEVLELGRDDPRAQRRVGAGVPPELEPLFSALADGLNPTQAFAEAGLDATEGLATLAALELAGHIRRQPGGGFLVTT